MNLLKYNSEGKRLPFHPSRQRRNCGRPKSLYSIPADLVIFNKTDRKSKRKWNYLHHQCSV